MRAALVAGALLLAVPAAAEAHGLVQRADLPIPEWLFGWGAAIVLVVSFAALAVLWPQPRLEEPRWRELPALRFLASRPADLLYGLTGFALLALVVWSGLAGEQLVTNNFAPTFVYVIFWVGLVIASILLGDVYRAVNPWRAAGRAAGALVPRRTPARDYPERMGHWPAAAGILVFTWMELAWADGSVPENIAWATVAYSLLTWIAMYLYGVERWCDRGEAFSVYFNLFARISPWERRDRAIGLRRVLGGLPQWRPGSGSVALLAVLIGTVTFDGFSQGAIWKDVQPELTSFFESVGLSPTHAVEAAATVGLLAGPLLVLGFYALGIRGARSVGGGFSSERLGRGFVHSLVPIAAVYALAHYLTLLVFQGQAIGYLSSDPLGKGWDLLGTSDAAIDYGVLGQNPTWYLQVGFVVAGHVAALVLAHDRALALYEDTRQGVRSQYWMLAVMVGFTTLALWLLAQANA